MGRRASATAAALGAQKHALSDRLSSSGLYLDRHGAGRGKHQPRCCRPPLAEGRRLELVSSRMTVELEPLGVGGQSETIKMHVEIGDPLVGIKLHRLFKIAHETHSSSGAKQRTSPIWRRIAQGFCCS